MVAPFADIQDGDAENLLYLVLLGLTIRPILPASLLNLLKKSRAKPSQIVNWGGDLREAQVDVPLSVNHSCVWPHRWAL
jgi:hypothetical protein